MGTYGPKPTPAPTGAIILHPGDNISALVRAAPTGATFYFEPGVYRGVSLAPNDGQTFIGAQGAVLSGAEVLTDWTPTSNLWVIGGQTQQGTIHASEEFLPGTQRPGYPETVFLNNTPLKPVDALSKVVPGTFYFDYAADKIYIADNPTGHTIEAGKLTDAFHGSATNVTVQNLVIEKYDPQIQDGAIQGGRGWTIQNNEVRLNYAVGIIGVDGSKLIGNYVHDNGEMGLGGFGDNILVQGNEIAKNGYWSGIDVLWEGGGFKFTNTDNLVVRGNYSHDNNGIGMWTDIDNIHTLYEDNVVVHNSMGGISHEISYQAIIRNNTLIGNGADDPRSWWWGNEIQIQNSQKVNVYGNRVEMTGGGNGIVMIQQDRGSGTFGTHTTTGNQIHDNIIVDNDGEGYIGGVADYNLSGMLNGGNTWSNNQYFMSDGGGRFQWGGDKTFIQFKGAAHETGSISRFNNTLIGGSGNDILNGGGGNDTLNGLAGADNMSGGAGNDVYYVDNAADKVFEAAGAGTDTVYASVNYALRAGQEVEYLRANAGATGLILTGNEFNNTVIGGAGNDRLYGGGGNDILNGGGGNDTLNGLAGADNMSGGAGNDVYYVDNAADKVFEAAGAGTDTVYASVNYALRAGQEVEYLRANAGATGLILTGNEFNNTVIGGAGNDRLYGGGGNDILNGGGGNDTLNGLAGADNMSGGAGNDVYYVDNAADKVFEAAGAGTDTVYASVNYALRAGQEVEYLRANAGATGLILTGNEFNNTVIGGAGNDRLYGGGGNDILNGGGGNDTLNGLAGADNMSGGAGNDVCYVDNAADKVFEAAGAGTDTVYASVNYALRAGQEVEYLRANAGATGLILTGNEFNNTVIGGAGNDRLYGGGGNDILNGGGGNDTLNGLAGADNMSGGAGKDVYYVDNAADKVFEAAGAGTDTVYASVNYALRAGQEVEYLRANAGATGLILTGNEFNNTVIGGAGNDRLYGGGGNDRLYGGGGNDALNGGKGNDALSGGNGNDVLNGMFGIDIMAGGAGNDTFAWNVPTEGGDNITDFKILGTDVLQFKAAAFGFTARHLLVNGSEFIANNSPVANHAGPTFLMETDAHNLFFDADGSGGGVAVLIAHINVNAVASDFHLV